MSYGPKGLNDHVDEVKAWCESKGWHDDLKSDRPNSAGDLLMLCVTELAEALEEVRDHRDLNEVYFQPADHCAKCQRNGVKRTLDGRGPTEHMSAEADGSADHPFDAAQKPEGVPIELADAAIRLFDMCGRWNIDLEDAVRIKMDYNATRPYKHGGRAI